jgi:glycerol-3-phosphate dehydrogenase (NAD(P)+)
MTDVAVIGATTWGTTIGRVLSKKGTNVAVLTKTEERIRELTEEQKRLRLSDSSMGNVLFTNNCDTALSSAELVILAVPAQTVRDNVNQIKDHITGDMILVSLAKGLEAATYKRMSEVINEEIDAIGYEQICVLSGPNLSVEINRSLPATSILASASGATAEKTKAAIDSPNFTVFTSNDIVGVELCGAMKNVIALGAGMIDGLVLGNNAKAAFITLGWEEVVSLGTALGAKPSTFFGLAGLGDLITTCAGSLSRNHYVGHEVASGRSLAEVRASMSNVAEGIDTTMAVHHLANKLGVQVPVITMIYKILFESLPAIEITNWFKKGLKSSVATTD